MIEVRLKDVVVRSSHPEASEMVGQSINILRNPDRSLRIEAEGKWTAQTRELCYHGTGPMNLSEADCDKLLI